MHVAVGAQIEAARLAAMHTTNPKEARRLRVCAAALERGVRKIQQEETILADVSSLRPW